ncbi:MAG: DNA methyltransferase [Pseudomonadota bacterium]
MTETMPTNTHVEMIALGDLIPYVGNARTHSKKQVRQIADSIQRFGFTNPILVDDNFMILAGYGRVMAAQVLGMESVPCRRLAQMSDAEKRAYILADNKLAQNAGWDEDLLAKELSLLLDEGQDINIALTGFSIAEVDVLLEPGGTAQEANAERDDALPAPVADAESAVTQMRDVWQLGPHRLVCGDARDVSAYAVLMEGESADMVFTDPPYNVPVDGHVCGSGKTKHREFAMASGEMSPDEFTAFLTDSLQLMADHSRDGSIHFVCMDWRHMREVMDAGQTVYDEMKNLIVWAKDNGGMGTFYRSRHELVFAFKNGTASHNNAFKLGQYGRNRTNVWNYRGITSATKEAREELSLHPTVKPAAMLADTLKDCCPRGGIVLDGFAGSGSIVIAAHKTGRRARAVEIDPLYCDTIIRRWQAWAKDDAVLMATGHTFEETAKERRPDPDAGSTNDKPLKPLEPQGSFSVQEVTP